MGIEMTLSRRDILLRTVAVAPIVAVAACSHLAITPTQLQQDAAAIINFATGELTSALAAFGITIPAAAVGDFNTALKGIAANANELLDALGNTAEPILSRIMTGLQVVANVLMPFFPGATVAYALVSAAVALVQGLLVSFQPAAAASLMAPAPAIRGLMPMTMGQARKTLGE